MPVHCDVRIANLSTEEFRELDYQVMRHAFDSHNDLGRLADERIYQSDLAMRLIATGMGVSRELAVRLSHQAFSKTLLLDLVVVNRAVYELKVAKSLTDSHVGQLLNFLLLLDLAHGKVINFGAEKVQTRFVNATLESNLRRAFQVPFFRVNPVLLIVANRYF